MHYPCQGRTRVGEESVPALQRTSNSTYLDFCMNRKERSSKKKHGFDRKVFSFSELTIFCMDVKNNWLKASKVQTGLGLCCIPVTRIRKGKRTRTIPKDTRRKHPRGLKYGTKPNHNLPISFFCVSLYIQIREKIEKR